MSAYRHHPAAGKRHAPASLDRPSLYFARIRAAHCLASGWTREQATGRLSEYGFLRSLDKSRAHPLAQLRMIEAAIRCDVACRDAVQAWRRAAA
jgi:hypothetical protein